MGLHVADLDRAVHDLLRGEVVADINVLGACVTAGVVREGRQLWWGRMEMH